MRTGTRGRTASAQGVRHCGGSRCARRTRVWIAEAFADALGGDLAETEAALLADDLRPVTHLVAWPGLLDRDDLAAATDGEPGPYSPYAVRMSGGDPADIADVREHRAAVQDEGSQLARSPSPAHR